MPGVRHATLMSVAACAVPRASDYAPVCPDYSRDVAPTVARACLACHGGDRLLPLGSYAQLLAAPRGWAAPEAVLGHPEVAAADTALLARWEDCGRGYFATAAVHPVGFLNPASADFHGETLRRSAWDFGACERCHGEVADPGGGKTANSCVACHDGGPTSCATCHPVLGGAHAAHTSGGAVLGLALGCEVCHLVPAAFGDPGHALLGPGTSDPPPAEVAFQGDGTYDVARSTCTVACHGDASPVWTAIPSGAGCATCHGFPPQGDHPEDNRCATCHGDPIADGHHLDGSVRIGDGSETCGACHSALGGAHAAHRSGRRLGKVSTCEDCHLVPAGPSFREAVRTPGHLDGDGVAEVFPGGHAGLGSAAGTVATYARDEDRCTAYCHGNGADLAADQADGIVRVLAWYGDADGMLCGACHGIPPADGRVEHADAGLFDCHGCHGGTVDRGGGIRPDGGHIDGTTP